MRIAALNTCNDDADYAKKYPNDGERFAILLRPLRPDWSFEVFETMKGDLPPDPAGFDGLIVTGSPASVNDNLPWIAPLMATIREAVARRVPLFGACFGLQAIAVALGGRVGPNAVGCRLGVTPTLFSDPQPWMIPARREVRLYSGNFEQVLEAPAAARAIGGDEHCTVGAMVVGDSVFATQYHPEMTKEFVAELIDDVEPKVGPDRAEAGRRAIKAETDAAVFAEWMVRFFEHAAALRGA